MLPEHFITSEYPEMDMNSTIAPHDIRDELSIVTVGLIDGVLMLAILFSNILVMLAVKLSRKLRCLTSCKFILNLAVCDFFVGLMVPYHLAFYLTENIFKAEIPCILRFVLIAFGCISSILNISVIAVDRYIAILHPLHYSRYMTNRVANTVMTCGWIFSFGVASILLYWNVWHPGSECELQDVMPKYYISFVLTPLFMTVWIATFAIYLRIWREASGHAKRLRNFQNGTASDWKSMQVFRTTKFKMVLLILGCFTVCWLPYFTVIILKTSTSIKVPSVMYEATFTLAISNSCMNPVIYAWKNSNFRQAFCCLLKFKIPTCEDKHNYITNHVPVAISGAFQKKTDKKHMKVLHSNIQMDPNMDNTVKDFMQKHKHMSFINIDTNL